MSEPNEARSSSRLWMALRSKVSCSIIFSLLGVVGMLVVVGGFTTALEATNSIEFCTSCHDMSYNFEEYKKTIHYSNPAGVRAVCSDCHVPKKNWFTEMGRKFEAASDVWAEIVGTIDTREKFDAKRMEMAKREWARMKESDSIGCRNCHSFESMDLEGQSKGARNQHTQASMKDSGKTCIDCHKGIAHHLPHVE